MKVQKILAKEILDSKGGKTIEAEVILVNGEKASAAVSSGISEGAWEAKTVPAHQAVTQIQETVSPAIIGKNFETQKEVDEILTYLSCGANASLSVSIAFSRAAKTLVFPKQIKSPKLLMLMFEGGEHGSKNLTVQEFMVVVKNYQAGFTAYQKVKAYLEDKNLPTTVGSEGGFSPPKLTDKEALSILKEVLGDKTPLALDVAADFQKVQPDYLQLVKDFPIILLEDPYSDNDWESWTKINSSLKKEVLIVGDDLTATSPERISEAAQKKAVGGVVIKPDQRRTLTEVLEAVETARKNKLKIVVSHRGRETNDAFVADLAIAIQADFVKFGAPARGERIAKYNRLRELTGFKQ